MNINKVALLTVMVSSFLIKSAASPKKELLVIPAKTSVIKRALNAQSDKPIDSTAKPQEEKAPVKLLYLGLTLRDQQSPYLD